MQALTFVLSAPGSIGMETSFVNLIEPGDKVVICINGVFGGRMRDICERIGAEVVSMENEWGTPVDLEALRQTLNDLYSRLEAAGLEMIVAAEHRLAPLTLVRIPQGVDDATVRGSLLQEQNIELGAGFGKFAGKAWRIGLMGQNASIDRADFMADALIAKLR